MPILKNKIVIYVTTRYITYALQFLLSLAIAVRLGPFYLGCVWYGKSGYQLFRASKLWSTTCIECLSYS